MKFTCTRATRNAVAYEAVQFCREQQLGTDFFTVEVFTLKGLMAYYVLFFIQLETQRVCLAGITPYPDQQWMEQQARNVTMKDWGFLAHCRYLLHDRVGKFCPLLRMLGISPAKRFPGPDLSSKGAEQIVLAQGSDRDGFFDHARFEPIRLIYVGWEARKAPVDAVVFFLDFPSYRTYQELAFRACDQHGLAE